MGFGVGFIMGALLSHKSDDPRKEPPWKPERGTVHSRGYLGLSTDFPVQVLISCSVPPSGRDDLKALVKWISFSSSPEQFASTDWNWVTIKKIDDTLHFIEEQKPTNGLGQLDSEKSGAGVAPLQDLAANHKKNIATATRRRADRRGSTSLVSRLFVASAIVVLVVVLADTLWPGTI